LKEIHAHIQASRMFEIAGDKLFVHQDHAAAFAEATVAHLAKPDNLATFATATNM
jgi:hypothetical protein